MGGDDNPQPTPAPAPTATPISVSTVDALQEVLEVHYRKSRSLILWGNSGCGKSSTIKAFADNRNLKFISVYAVTLDPLTTALQVADHDNKVIDSYANLWLREICEPNGPELVLLLDEVNKYSQPSTMNMLNELILERKYLSHKVRDNVFIVGCANFVAESEQANPLDKSILQRVTNILFKPEQADMLANMRSDLARSLLSAISPKLKGKELFEEEILSNLSEENLRQIDEVAYLCGGETLSSEATRIICEGRVGKKGKTLCDIIQKQQNYVSALDNSTFSKVVAMYNSGAHSEVRGLVTNGNDSDIACDLVIQTKSAVLKQAVLTKYGNKVQYKGEAFLVACADANI